MPDRWLDLAWDLRTISTEELDDFYKQKLLWDFYYGSDSTDAAYRQRFKDLTYRFPSTAVRIQKDFFDVDDGQWPPRNQAARTVGDGAKVLRFIRACIL